MATYRDVPCVFCGNTFTWQNDFNPHTDAPLCCHFCASKKKVDYTCTLCGAQETRRYGNDEQKILLQICFSCAFWIRLLTKPHENRIITPDHKHFQAAWWGIQRGARSNLLGFGGRVFRIEFLDGKYRYTNNLWSQGDIPEFWQSRFPANVVSLESPLPSTIPQDVPNS